VNARGAQIQNIILSSQMHGKKKVNYYNQLAKEIIFSTSLRINQDQIKGKDGVYLVRFGYRRFGVGLIQRGYSHVIIERK
jgi:hypothetical protein